MRKYGLWLLIILVNSWPVSSLAMDIVVVGLFADKAVIEIDGQQRFLQVGATSPEGVTLISASSEKALLEIDGKQQTYQLGDHISSHYSAAPAQPKVSIWPTNGMYKTTGNINGYTVDFLVDTGATSVALNAATARRLGIDFYRGELIGLRTASGHDQGYRITLNKIQIEDITLYNIAAVVLDGPEPAIALLGMSFLGQLDMQRNGERLDLLQKY